MGERSPSRGNGEELRTGRVRNEPTISQRTRKLNQALQLLQKRDRIFATFVDVAEEFAGDEEFPDPELRNMFRFADAYHKGGLRAAVALEEKAAIPIQIKMNPEDPENPTSWEVLEQIQVDASLVGFIGSHHSGRMKKFYGIAVMSDPHGSFPVPVWIYPVLGETSVPSVYIDYRCFENVVNGVSVDEQIEQFYPPMRRGTE